MTTATVRYISNGYMVSSQGINLLVPANLYAATLPEVVYWLGKIFEPYGAALARTEAPPKSIAPAIVESTDPLLNQEAQVSDVASGGFLTRQMPGMSGGGKMIDTFCPTMDAVADQLTAIFTPPAPPPQAP